MKVPNFDVASLAPVEAIKIQQELSNRVVESSATDKIELVAGVDVGFEGDRRAMARAAVVVLNFPELTLIEFVTARVPVRFPYVPGLLAFREIPVVLRALGQLQTEPDVIIVDGHGRAHPRRFGIACHLGVLLDRPTVGCAKSILCGKAAQPTEEVGSWALLLDHDEIIGAAVRTRARMSPVYVSIGHRVSLASSIELVLRSCSHYRLPEPTRLAHRAASGSELPLPRAKVGSS